MSDNPLKSFLYKIQISSEIISNREVDFWHPTPYLIDISFFPLDQKDILTTETHNDSDSYPLAWSSSIFQCRE